VLSDSCFHALCTNFTYLLYCDWWSRASVCQAASLYKQWIEILLAVETLETQETLYSMGPHPLTEVRGFDAAFVKLLWPLFFHPYCKIQKCNKRVISLTCEPDPSRTLCAEQASPHAPRATLKTDNPAQTATLHCTKLPHARRNQLTWSLDGFTPSRAPVQ